MLCPADSLLVHMFILHGHGDWSLHMSPAVHAGYHADSHLLVQALPLDSYCMLLLPAVSMLMEEEEEALAEPRGHQACSGSTQVCACAENVLFVFIAVCSTCMTCIQVCPAIYLLLQLCLCVAMT